jgi:hypothetical protein
VLYLTILFTIFVTLWGHFGRGPGTPPEDPTS